MRPGKSSLRLTLYGTLMLSGIGAAQAGTIDFDSFTGPTLYADAGNAQTLSIPTAVGIVTISGGAILTAATFLPADQTSIYGTAANAANIGVTVGSGFTNPIVITFPTAITNFYLDLFNGNTQDVTYALADNAGHSSSFDLVPNLNGGNDVIGFAAAGNVITVGATSGQSTSGGMTVDFFVDNLTFDEPLPQGLAAPEPATFALLGVGIMGVGFVRQRRQSPRTILPS